MGGPLKLELFALELSFDIGILYCLHYNFKISRCHYAKTTLLIPFKLTAFNSDTLGYLNINFLRDQMRFDIAEKFYNMD